MDAHVHLREPGATQKEDFETGTKAAIAGGYTTVLDMPNNQLPVTSDQALENKIKLAEGRIYSDLGFHFGGSGQSSMHFQDVKSQVFGLKVYMNHTTGLLLVKDEDDLDTIFKSWPKDKILMVHAEGPTLKLAIEITRKHGNRLHVCHIAQKMELQLIQQAKAEGMNVTCEVGIHHLYLIKDDLKRLGPFGMMRPPLASKEDQDYLWKNIKDIDIIASDHAPHTRQEKLGSDPPNGVPGLETTLPLLLTAMYDERLTINDIQRMCHTNPKKIFNIPKQEDTYVEVDPTIRYTLNAKRLYTKCGWTPFEGMKVRGKVLKVVLRGQTVFEGGKIMGKPSGRVVYPHLVAGLGG